MMFGSIILSGFQMIASAGFSQRNITIAAVSLAMGIGFTQVSDIFVAFPELLQNIFVGNSVALTFLAAVILSACLPKDTIIDGPLVHKERSEGFRRRFFHNEFFSCQNCSYRNKWRCCRL